MPRQTTQIRTTKPFGKHWQFIITSPMNNLKLEKRDKTAESMKG